MSETSRATRELLDALEGRWPASPVARGSAGHDAALVELLESQPEPVARRSRGLLADPAGEPLARTLVYALQLARSSGLKAAGWLGDDRLHLVDARGRAIAFALMAVDGLTDPSGDSGAAERLNKVLGAAFGDRRYMVWVRRPLPATLDAAAIGRAVTLWLSAIERGEWHGRHAIYEDEGVELELVLTDLPPAPGRRSEVLRLLPVNALERLSFVDQALMEQAAQHDEEHPEVPLVFVVGATAPWRLPRGFCEQLLYGTPDWVRTSSDPPSYEAGFHASGRSLLSDPLASNVASIWWVEPGAGDALAFRSWAHDNPWARCAWLPEPPPGPRFARVGEERGSRDRKVEVMRWTAPFPARP